MLLAVRIWILVSTLLVGAGWILSAAHLLNRIGYGMVLVLAVSAALVFQWKYQPIRKGDFSRFWHKFNRRYRRFLPLCFLLMAGMSLVGGMVYVTTDTDGQAYRVPRILHWLGQAQWYWIRTTDYRMNIAGCNYEWLCTPLMLFSHTDRLIFIWNVLSYLMLPGLVFSVFGRLGVRPRLAWWWMWLLASGWCYVFQAGATFNDSLAAIYALASVDLALRAGQTKSASDLWLSFLAAALVTGVKQTDSLLVLLWLIAAWPSRGLFFRPAFGGAAALMAGLLASGVPLAIINIEQTGVWTGVPAVAIKAELHSPLWGILGNTFCLSAQNLMPPLFPWANQWDDAMNRFLDTPFGRHFGDFEKFGYINLTQAESNAGIGLGVCLLAIISVLAAQWISRFRRAGQRVSSGEDWQRRLLRLAPWALLLIFMAKVGTFQNARHLAPYYVFLFPALLTCQGMALLPRQNWWRYLAMLMMLGTVMLVVLSRSRPMFPARTLFAQLAVKHPQSHLLTTLAEVYSFNMAFESVRNFFESHLPMDGTTVGYLTTYGGQAEPGLWLPLGQRKVERVLPEDTQEQMRQAGIHLLVLDEAVLRKEGQTLQQKIVKYQARLVDQVPYVYNPHFPPIHLYILDLKTGDASVSPP